MGIQFIQQYTTYKMESNIELYIHIYMYTDIIYKSLSEN